MRGLVENVDDLPNLRRIDKSECEIKDGDKCCCLCLAWCFIKRGWAGECEHGLRQTYANQICDDYDKINDLSDATEEFLRLDRSDFTFMENRRCPSCNGLYVRRCLDKGLGIKRLYCNRCLSVWDASKVHSPT